MTDALFLKVPRDQAYQVSRALNERANHFEAAIDGPDGTDNHRVSWRASADFLRDAAGDVRRFSEEPVPARKATKRRALTTQQRLNEIAHIILRAEDRCMAVDGPVTPTTKEITEKELQEIYLLATGK